MSDEAAIKWLEARGFRKEAYDWVLGKVRLYQDFKGLWEAYSEIFEHTEYAPTPEAALQMMAGKVRALAADLATALGDT